MPGRFIALEALFLLVVINLALQPLTEPDFGWHLRSGLDLVASGGRLPDTDPYSHTMPDWPWVEHAWLTDLLIGRLYHGFGRAGALAIIVMFGCITAGAWGVAGLTARAGPEVRLCACSASLWVALPFLGARTQLITVFGMAVLGWMLHRIRNGASHLIWWLPALFLLWGNLHGGFTAGLFLLAVVIGLFWLRPLLARVWPALRSLSDEPALPAAVHRRLIAAAGMSAAITLVNPYGWRLHREILESLADRFMIETLQEWQSPSLETVAGQLFLSYLLALAVAMLCWYRRIEPVRWGVLLVFLALACRHFRNIPLFLIVSLPLLAEVLQEALDRMNQRVLVRQVAASWWRGGWMLVLATVLLVLGPGHLQRVWRSGVDPAGFFRATSYPIEAVEWVRHHRDRVGTKLYNEYGHGGFLLWWLPDEKIFIDGRMPAWHLGSRWILRDYVALNSGGPDSTAVLDKYDVDWAIVKGNGPVSGALEQRPMWRKQYEDEKVQIYVKLPEGDGSREPASGK
jgi:hypothetical protein